MIYGRQVFKRVSLHTRHFPSIAFFQEFFSLKIVICFYDYPLLTDNFLHLINATNGMYILTSPTIIVYYYQYDSLRFINVFTMTGSINVVFSIYERQLREVIW